MIPAWLAIPVAGGLLWGLATLLARSGARASPAARQSGQVFRVAQDGLTYFVMNLGGGNYEVRREDAPEVWVIIDQKGEVAVGEKGAELERLRADMLKFPRDLFAEPSVAVAGLLDFERPTPAELAELVPGWYVVMTYVPERRAWQTGKVFHAENTARATFQKPFGGNHYLLRWLATERRWSRAG
jgi:hypothetical protein